MRCTRAVMHATNVNLLMEQVCAVIVDAGYRFCWIGAAEQNEEKTVRPLAWAGHSNGYLSGISATWSDSELDPGPAGKAIRTATPVVFQNLAGSPGCSPWETEARKRGFRSSSVLPLMDQGMPFGALSIYADQRGAFGEAELESLANLADILSFGITNLRERHEAEAALTEVTELNQQVISSAHEGITVYDQDLRCQLWNPFMEELTGVSAREMVGNFPLERFPFLRKLGVEEGLQKAMAGETNVSEDIPLTLSQSGRTFWVSARRIPLRNSFGQVTRVLVTLRDITDRRKAEEALRQSEGRLRQAARASQIGTWDHDHLSGKVYWSPEQRDIYGLGPDEVVTLSLFLDHVYPEDREAMAGGVRRAHDPAGDGLFDVEHRIVRRDGDLRWLITRSQTFFDGEGAARQSVRTIGASLDITDRKRLEAQYEQAQKMQAVGRLAGGVAHDFNNILSVIMGYAELSNRFLDEKHPVVRNIAQIKHAATRAASLTKQLLAFSRQQVSYPSVLDLNKVVGNLCEMLTWLVGEDVEISFRPGERLGLIRVDPGQVEQILMNLGVNARDAMPKGGKIVIETSNVTLDENYVQDTPAVAGAYVMLSFGDTGCGIAKENLPRIFEPFFTTKGPSQGTGLGLATVYGIVKQSNGYIWADSEPDKGAIFKIYFPRVEDKESVLESESDTEGKVGSETILLVEDEIAVREVAAALLETGGFTVLKAENAAAALAVAKASTEEIDLVITDVIMPTMSGVELCSRLRKLRPGIKLLYMSGYTGDQLDHYGQFASDITLLEKPFTKTSLLKKVRSILDS